MRGGTLRHWLGLSFATLVLFLLLIQPNHPLAIGWGALLVFPLELPVIVLILLAVGRGPLATPVRAILTFILSLIFVQKGADLVSFHALSRGFNPVTDLTLIEAFVRLLAGSLGGLLAALAILASVALIVGVAAVIWWATGRWTRAAPGPVWARAAGIVAILPAAVAVAEIGDAMGRWDLPLQPPGTAFSARLAVERVAMVGDTFSELRAFRTAAASDPFAGATGLLEAIDRDVLVIFVESYGRTSLDTLFYADLHRQTLASYEARLAALGLSMQSGILTSPTQGGQSWLAHSTFANGLWIDNQISYAAALSSGRETLYHHAAENGFRTATVMPQITLDWPESERMGFGQVFAARDLGYAGLPFNWVTMPDQFSLAALDRLLRSGDEQRRLFAQVALISSHAPWVPVPEIIPWDSIGDGQVYNDIAVSGDPPEVVWRDYDRVRAQYRLAVDYALRSVLEYALLHAEDPPLMIVVGDHQAAGFIALDERAEVPIHVIGPERLVAALSEVAPTPGLLPDVDVPVIAMDRMRDIILRAYTNPPRARVGN